MMFLDEQILPLDSKPLASTSAAIAITLHVPEYLHKSYFTIQIQTECLKQIERYHKMSHNRALLVHATRDSNLNVPDVPDTPDTCEYKKIEFDICTDRTQTLKNPELSNSHNSARIAFKRLADLQLVKQYIAKLAYDLCGRYVFI